jgi:cytochrome b pre-mRNA-processing protein 3
MNATARVAAICRIFIGLNTLAGYPKRPETSGPVFVKLPARRLPVKRREAAPSGAWSMFGVFRRRAQERQTVAGLYAAAATQARLPAFYADLGVPDTVDGRFDLLVLHVWMVLHRLDAEPDSGQAKQDLFDAMFAHLDLTLREMGAQDLGVGRRIKRMADGFNGRCSAFREAWLGGDAAKLQEALARNVFGKATPSPDALASLADYLGESIGRLAATPASELMAGQIAWPTLRSGA